MRFCAPCERSWRPGADAEHTFPPHLQTQILLVLVLGIFLVKVVRQRARDRQPRRQRDTQSIFRLPRNARHQQPHTQTPLAANLKALDALYGSRPAPSHHLMRGQPDAILQWYALASNRDVGDQDGLFGLPLGHAQDDSGNFASAPSWLSF